jgi:hypothetical protein
MENHEDPVDVDVESINSTEPDNVDIELDDDESESGSTADQNMKDGKDASDIQDMNSKLPKIEGKKETDILQWLRRSKPLLVAADDLFDGIATDNLLQANPRLNFKRKVRRFFSSSNLYIYI